MPASTNIIRKAVKITTSDMLIEIIVGKRNAANSFLDIDAVFLSPKALYKRRT